MREEWGGRENQWKSGEGGEKSFRLPIKVNDVPRCHRRNINASKRGIWPTHFWLNCSPTAVKFVFAGALRVCFMWEKLTARESKSINQTQNSNYSIIPESEQWTRDINVFDCDTNSQSSVVFVRFNPKSINCIGSANSVFFFSRPPLRHSAFAAPLFSIDFRHFTLLSNFTFTIFPTWIRCHGSWLILDPFTLC